MEKLLAMYEKGDITADHLVAECLHMIDPADPALVLARLPNDVLSRMLHYAHEYRAGTMRTNYGLQAAVDQVEAAKAWIENRIRQSA